MRVLIDLPNGLGLVFSARSSTKQAVPISLVCYFFFICSYIIQTELEMLEPIKFTVLRNLAREMLSSFVASLRFNLILSSHFLKKHFAFFFTQNAVLK